MTCMRMAFLPTGFMQPSQFLNARRHKHSSTLSAGIAHSVIVYPRSTQDVVKVVKVATKYRMPVIPYSGATSLEGQFRGHRLGGICVDLNHMDRIIQLNVDDSDIVCQPAARWMDINELLKEKANAVRYGTARGEWFLNATVVLPSGEVIKTRRRSRKSAAGLDMTKLFVGAEGTLGIVTEGSSATAASIEVMNQGVGIQCVELLDSLSLKAVNTWGKSKRVWPEKDSLFFKFQGPTPASLKETAAIVKQVVGKHGGTGFSLARNDKEAEEFWSDRKNLYWSGQSLLQGDDVRAMTTDVCVPVSRLPQLVSETQKDLESVGLVHSIVGHVGDGNFHALILFKTDEGLKAAHAAVKRISKRAIALDGTCTGEHGVGIGKREYLVEELGQGTVELMKTVKRAIDPLGLFNPGKLYPETSSPAQQKEN
ncbi:hypothetical protein D9619_012599 [Psilocybe cf. subviscida]|uniref:D-lactate dehydrogenase (cytochrome) n=1 Tax=Psilocybe cf. subviscida TaxID=2480587 RepID=A0A8H5EZ67_9AGAR|nr:hypothetical protein D9619_012599 [Psilocybe cf. subviscida]